MVSIVFDTLKFANTLKEAGVSPSHAEAQAKAMVAAVGEIDVATRHDLSELELRMMLKIGGMLVAAVGVLIAAMRIIHQG